MGENWCPQCGCDVTNPTYRLVQDSCGHKKCRGCLLKDETNCKLCDSLKQIASTTESVIKRSSDVVPVSTSGLEIIPIQYAATVGNSVEADQYVELPLTCTIKEEEESPEGIDKRQESVINKAEGKKRSPQIPQHITVLNDEKAPQYHCTICEKSFSSKSNVRYHSYCFNEKKPFICPTCGKDFASKSNLKSHALTHSSTKPYVCDICNKGFTVKGKLNRHKKLHIGIKSFACNECGKTFVTKDGLVSHEKTHASEKLLSCPKCSKKFSNTSNLNKHLLTHNPEKVHMCDQCGKRFKTKWALTLHRRGHLRQKPHKCLNCFKAFSNTKDLKRHKLIHVDVKPYICGVCETSFRRKDNLERHMKNSHPGKETPPVVKKLPVSQSVIVEKPNAIKVIMAAAPSMEKEKTQQLQSKPVPVINGPFKLAFKTSAFKNNYNIHRDYIEPPKIHPKKPYDLEESVNICQRILSPHSPPKLKRANVKDSEKLSVEICQKIMTPTTTGPTTLHYETSFEHKQHAMIKNIKFKLPPNYTNFNNVDKDGNLPEDANTNAVKSSNSLTITKVEPKQQEGPAPGTTSVIVNNSVNNPGMHWRRRTLQNLNPNKNT